MDKIKRNKKERVKNGRISDLSSCSILCSGFGEGIIFLFAIKTNNMTKVIMPEFEWIESMAMWEDYEDFGVNESINEEIAKVDALVKEIEKDEDDNVDGDDDDDDDDTEIDEVMIDEMVSRRVSKRCRDFEESMDQYQCKIGKLMKKIDAFEKIVDEKIGNIMDKIDEIAERSDDDMRDKRKRVCFMSGCAHPIGDGDGLCETHRPFTGGAIKKGKECNFEGCTRPRMSIKNRKRCELHHQRRKRYKSVM